MAHCNWHPSSILSSGQSVPKHIGRKVPGHDWERDSCNLTAEQSSRRVLGTCCTLHCGELQ
eukprot:2730360-Rhodomonas_salina.1